MSLLTLAAGCWMAAFLGPPPDSVEGDLQDVVILAPGQPVFLRLHLQVDGRGFRSLQPALVRRLFDAFDGDKDGSWSREEQEAARKSGRLAMLGNDATFDPRALDKDENGKLDGDEFLAHALPALGPPLVVRADPQSPTNLVGLLERLDLDEDGRLSGDELRSAWQTLRKGDLDDDEVLSLEELLPVQNPVGQVAMPTRVESPVVALSPESIPSLSRTIVRRYAPRGKTRVPFDALKLPDAAIKPFDADGDGELNRRELEALLASPPPHQRILVKLPKEKRSRIILQAIDGERVEGRGAAFLPIRAGAFATEIRGAMVKSETADNRSFYRIQFRRSDADKNKSLDETEYAAVGLEATFAQVDRNGDKMLTEAELLEQLSLDDQLNQSRIELLISSEGKSLFELLDANRDRRIAPREFLDAASRLMPRDQNQDGLLDSGELDNRIRIAVNLDRPKLFQANDGAMAARAPRGVPRRKVDGPDWFQKMDRNRDGDVSAREFLGPAEAFERLDADKNGVLDPAEAALTAAAGSDQE